MDIYAKGQLSYLILNCLLDRDFYGLDIISEVKTRSNGRIELKKPSVYSNLTRMEKQGQVSSYMRSSDVGPNRKYYSVTEKGRAYYYELKEEFDRNHFDVFRDYQEEDAQPEEERKEVQDDFFDFSTFKTTQTSTTEEVKQTTVQEQVQIQMQEPPQEQKPTQEVVNFAAETETQKAEAEINEDKVEPKQDDAKFLEQEEPADYNKRIYDITKDFNKYRKKRSFAEDQIAIAEDETSLQEAEARRQEHLENFKSALLANKGKFADRMSEDEFNRVANPKPTPAIEEEKPAEPVRDDGVFITETRENIYQTRKIEPPRLKVNTTPLPAPKRDSTIDPSHKEIISKIYAKSKGEVASNEKVIKPQESLYDYEDLKDYYSSQNISFRVYQQNKNMAVHNTNKIELVLSLVSFALACIVSGVLFPILYATKHTLPTTDFLYIVLPLALLIDVAVKTFALRYTSWEPKPMFPQWLVWSLFVLCIGVVFGVNFIFGMNPNDMLASATTLFLPIALLLVLIPVRYYIKRFAYKAYWR